MISTLTELGSVARVFNGKTPSKKEQRRGGFPVLKIKDVDAFGQFRGTFDSFVEDGLAEAFPEKLIRENDVLLLNAAHNADYVASKSFFAAGSAVGALATGEWMIVRANPNQLDSKFVFFLLETPSIKSKISNIVRGIHLYPTDMAELAIQLPPLAEQRRVARQLEGADHLCRMRRYALQTCDELLPAAFIEMFGDWATATTRYPVKPLKEIVDPERIVTYGIVQAGPHVPDGVPYIKTGDIVDGVIRVDGLERTSHAIADSYKRSEVKFGDLVISIRATVGTIAVLPRELDGANLTQGTARIAPTHGMEKLFLLWQIRSNAAQRWIKQQIKGTTFLEITLERLRKMPIFVPPLPVQQQFAAVVGRHEKLRATHVEALREADHLFQTLLCQAFNAQ